MSSFQVSRLTVDRIVSLVRGNVSGTDGAHYWAETTDVANADLLGQRLIDHNLQALDARYADGGPRCAVQTEYRWPMTTYPVFDCIKALDCWLYQCAEGDVPNTVLYHHMSRLRDDVCRMIVSDLPEYAKSDAWQ